MVIWMIMFICRIPFTLFQGWRMKAKSFEFMLYPGGRHGWGGAKAIHSRNEANKFWLRSFFGEK